MKAYTSLLLVIIGCFIMVSKSYSAKDTLPPNPIYEFCPYCGGTHDNAYVEDMPQTYERSKLDTIILHKESFNYDFSYNEFRPGIDYRTRWNAKVRDINKDAFIKITFKDFEGNDTTIQNNFYATKLSIRPDLNFGLLSIGETKELVCWIKCESTVDDTITNIKFKNNDRGFEIICDNLPFIIKSGDSIKIKVKFKAYFEGDFSDSIGIEAKGFDDYLSSVKAQVGAPSIEVTNCWFGDKYLNSVSNCSILIWNHGITDLIVTGYIGPRYPNIYIPYFDDFNENSPLIIEPNGVYSCEIIFKPYEEKLYSDSILFISNSIKTIDADSIAELSGKGVAVEDVFNNNIGNNFNINPNPADDFISVNFIEEFIKSDVIKLFDSFGNVVYENGNIIENNFKINTSGLASGMYFLRVGSMFMRKVVVVH